MKKRYREHDWKSKDTKATIVAKKKNESLA